MRDLVPSVAVGKVNDQIVLDLQKEEDNFGQADLPLAIIPRTGEVILMQMDGHLTKAEFDKALEMGVGACKKIYALQKDALARRYAIEKVVDEAEEPAAEQTAEG
jgi:exosome complex component RRP41